MRIAVLDAAGSYFSAPTLRCMLEEFDRAGCDVDVYLRTGSEGLAGVCGARPMRFPVPFAWWAGDWKATVRQWRWFLRFRGRAGSRALNSGRYDLTIGVNPEGVIAAHRYWRDTGTPFVYLSFEMLFRDELPTRGLLRFKEDEVAASRDAALIIAPDKWRARLLIGENGVESEKLVLLPVAPRGPCPEGRTDYLRERLAIGDDQAVILHAGAFKVFTDAEGIITTVSAWPKDYVLVLNTFYRAENEPHIHRIRALGLDNVKITDGGLAKDEFEAMLRSADVGLALYKPSSGHPFHGKNIGTMGLSSGKLASYVRCGLPCVCSGNPELRRFLRTYRFGEYVDEVALIPEAVREIRGNWTAYSNQARQFFRDQLDFARFWPPVWLSFQRIAAHAGQ